MKGMSGKVLALIMTLIIAIILLALLVTGYYKLVPFLSSLADGVVKAVKNAFCSNLPLIGSLCKIVLGA